ncbi:MAG: KH domain-containing protein [Candidatus Micrarchaeaceae archaeon]
MMQQVYIPRERIRKLKEDKELVKRIEKLCGCSIRFCEDDIVEVTGEAYPEYAAKSVIFAFGRGFEITIACKLADKDYYFNSIDLGQVISSDKRVRQLKARIIGKEGRTKRYIEEVSSAKISVYGDTVSFIGTIEEINEAETAVNTLMEGGTHRLAYIRMEAAHRKNKENAKKADF